MLHDIFVILCVCLFLYVLFLPVILKIKQINRDKKKVKLLEKLVEEKEKQKNDK